MSNYKRRSKELRSKKMSFLLKLISWNLRIKDIWNLWFVMPREINQGLLILALGRIHTSQDKAIPKAFHTTSRQHWWASQQIEAKRLGM